jgi:hypothetical protein
MNAMMALHGPQDSRALLGNTWTIRKLALGGMPPRRLGLAGGFIKFKLQHRRRETPPVRPGHDCFRPAQNRL